MNKSFKDITTTKHENGMESGLGCLIREVLGHAASVFGPVILIVVRMARVNYYGILHVGNIH